MIAAAVMMVLPAAVASGGATTGRVTDAQDRPIAGALVTLTRVEPQRATTVYSDAGGGFTLPPLERVAYALRVRRTGYRDLSLPSVSLPRTMPLALRLER